MKIAFCGTPDFAVPSLQALYDAGHELMVFTQPDRKKGRGGKLTMPEVKELALQLGIPVAQFEKISCEEGVVELTAFAPDLMVTAAFGQILTEAILAIPKKGCINVHGSLLPKYRGASPIQQAVINGDKITGITTMLTDIGLDTGDILLSRQVEIGENETAGELFDRMAQLGATVLVETIDKLMAGELVPTKQNSELATKCKTIKKEKARIDFTRSAREIHNMVRGMNPWPICFTSWNGETVKIHKTVLRPDMKSNCKPGTCFLANSKQGLFVATGDGVLEIVTIQLQNGRAMTAKELLNSKKLQDEVFV